MKIKITAVRQTEYKDLMELYENPIEHACEIKVGQVFICENGQKPQGFCDSYPQFVKMVGGQPLFIHKKAYIVAVEAVYNCIN